MDTKVKCPVCGEEINIDDCDDVYDTDENCGEYIKKSSYICHNCNTEFHANIIYQLKLKAIDYLK